MATWPVSPAAIPRVPCNTSPSQRPSVGGPSGAQVGRSLNDRAAAARPTDLQSVVASPHIASLVEGLTMANPRRKVFISYHHAGDQAYYDAFSKAFHDRY